jgi:hypothetical protein
VIHKLWNVDADERHGRRNRWHRGESNWYRVTCHRWRSDDARLLAFDRHDIDAESVHLVEKVMIDGTSGTNQEQCDDCHSDRQTDQSVLGDRHRSDRSIWIQSKHFLSRRMKVFAHVRTLGSAVCSVGQKVKAKKSEYW